MVKVGFPIRKSSDQSLLTTPRRLSQRATSFVACTCQGIHQMLLPHARESTPSTTSLHKNLPLKDGMEDNLSQIYICKCRIAAALDFSLAAQAKDRPPCATASI